MEDEAPAGADFVRERTDRHDASLVILPRELTSKSWGQNSVICDPYDLTLRQFRALTRCWGWEISAKAHRSSGAPRGGDAKRRHREAFSCDMGFLGRARRWAGFAQGVLRWQTAALACLIACFKFE